MGGVDTIFMNRSMVVRAGNSSVGSGLGFCVRRPPTWRSMGRMY